MLTGSFSVTEPAQITPGDTAWTETLERKEALPPEALLREIWPPGAEKIAFLSPMDRPTERAAGEAPAGTDESRISRAVKREAMNTLEPV